MAEDEWNTLCIVHYSEYKRAYCIDGGPESLQELELEEFEEEEVAEYELYKHEECPSEYWDTDSEDESEDEEGPEQEKNRFIITTNEMPPARFPETDRHFWKGPPK